MSNDTYSGSHRSDLRPATPEDADGFNVDARALRQIKRFLKNSDGLLKTVTDIIVNSDNLLLDKFKDQQIYSRPNQVIALRSDLNPNESDKFKGKWYKLNSTSICGTGNASFITYDFGIDKDAPNIPITDYRVEELNTGYWLNGGTISTEIVNSNIRITPNGYFGVDGIGYFSYIREDLYITIPIYPDLNDNITITIYVNGNGNFSGYPYNAPKGFEYTDDRIGSLYDGVLLGMWLSHSNSASTKYYNFNLTTIGNNASKTFTINKSTFGNAPYLVIDFGNYFQGSRYIFARTPGNQTPFIDIAVRGKQYNIGPDYELNWVLTATQYNNCTLDQVREKHSNKTYRNMLRIYKENDSDVARISQIYFYTFVGNLSSINSVSFSMKNAWSLYSNEYMNTWPNLALSGTTSTSKYPNYRIKVVLSKTPRWDADGILIGEATIDESLKNGIYFDNIENTMKDTTAGYIVVSVVEPQDAILDSDTLWWLVDAEMTVDLHRDFNSNNYDTFNVELRKDYQSVVPMNGINFWKRIDDGTE